MARRKSAGKDSMALPRRPAGGGRTSTRKPTASKAARIKKRAAKAALPRKRPPAEARKPRVRAAPRPGGRVRKAARKGTIKKSIRDETDVALDPEPAEQARGETALLGRGPNWWNSSLGGAKPGARVPPALRRGAGEDDPDVAIEPPIPIGIFALREGAPDVELDATEKPEAGHAIADQSPVAAEAPDEMPSRPQAAPQTHAAPVEPPAGAEVRKHEPVAGIAAERDDEPADAGPTRAAAPAAGVMQMLLGTVPRSRPDGPGAVLPPEPIHTTERAVPTHAPAKAPRASTPFDGDEGLAGRKLTPADLESLDAEIASTLTGLDGLDGAEDVLPRNLHGPRGSAGAEHRPAEPGPRPPRPAAPGREAQAGAPGAQPRTPRPRGEASSPAPAKQSPSFLVAALAAFNYPLRGLPPPARRIVGWIAASLLLWVPIVWLIALYFIGR